MSKAHDGNREDQGCQDVQQFDVVEINPAAVKLGLTQVTENAKKLLLNRKEILKNTLCETSKTRLDSPYPSSNNNQFGVDYTPIKLYHKEKKETEIPQEEDRIFEQEIRDSKESIGNLTSTSTSSNLSDDEEFDYNFELATEIKIDETCCEQEGKKDTFVCSSDISLFSLNKTSDIKPLKSIVNISAPLSTVMEDLEEKEDDDAIEEKEDDDAIEDRAQETEKLDSESSEQNLLANESEEEDTEWDEFELNELSTDIKGSSLQGDAPHLVSFDDIHTHYRKSPEKLEHFKQEIIRENEKSTNSIRQSRVRSVFSRFAALFLRSNDIPSLEGENLHEEKTFLFSLSKIQMTSGDDFAKVIMQSLYKRLTQTNRNMPITGKHWETIGFQGNDPGTDLRSAGILGVVQMIWLLEKYPVLAHDCFELSKHKENGFPLMAISLNFTLICIQTLRQGKLNKFCNSRSSVFEPFNLLFTGLWYSMFCKWKDGSSGIGDFPEFLSNTQKIVRNSPEKIIRKVDQRVK